MQKLTTLSPNGLRNGNYKNDRMQLQVLSTLEEPINSISPEKENKLPSALGMETKLERGRNREMYIPIVSENGKQLMPCKSSKARKLLERGFAEKRWKSVWIKRRRWFVRCHIHKKRKL